MIGTERRRKQQILSEMFKQPQPSAPAELLTMLFISKIVGIIFYNIQTLNWGPGLL